MPALFLLFVLLLVLVSGEGVRDVDFFHYLDGYCAGELKPGGVMVGGKRTLVCGYGGADEGGALATQTAFGKQLIPLILNDFVAKPKVDIVYGCWHSLLFEAACGIDLLVKYKPLYDFVAKPKVDIVYGCWHSLLFEAACGIDLLVKYKPLYVYGCRHLLPDDISLLSVVAIGGKFAQGGYGDEGNGIILSMRGAGSRVSITEVDLICALVACFKGFHVVTHEPVIRGVIMEHSLAGSRDDIVYGCRCRAPAGSAAGSCCWAPAFGGHGRPRPRGPWGSLLGGRAEALALPFPRLVELAPEA